MTEEAIRHAIYIGYNAMSLAAMRNEDLSTEDEMLAIMEFLFD
jgi:hypothetical protein